MTTTTGPALRSPRSEFRSVALPSEHGGWGLTAEPALVGLIVAPSAAGACLAGAALTAFLVRTPLKVAAVELQARIDAIKKAAFLDRGSAPGGRGSTEWRMAEIPSANLHGTAKDLARMMSVIATGGTLDGRAVLSQDTLDQATRERIHGQDKVLP